MEQMNVLTELEELHLVKRELESIRDDHKYGLWSKKINDDGTFNYQRVCKECGYIENISANTLDDGIEKELKHQEKAAKLVDFFVNTDANELTDDHILDFLVCTIDLQSRMDIDRIYSKLIEINKVYEVHNSYPENLIYNAVLSLKRIGQIPEELFKDMYNYSNRTSEYLGKEDMSFNTKRAM